MIRSLLVAGLLASLSLAAGAQTSFWLKNTDPTAVFATWAVAGPLPAPPARVLDTLVASPGGGTLAYPGERVRLTLAPGQLLVGAFLPGAGPLDGLSPVAGGFLLASEAPARGTLLVDRPTWAGANRGRAVEAPLGAWGLAVPDHHLDGRVDDWARVPSAVDWGPGFLPSNLPWPESWPRPTLLAVDEAEGALWLRFSADKPWSSLPAGVSLSLALKRPGALLEWPVTGTDPRVLSWTGPGEPGIVGVRVVVDRHLEARLAWDRLTELERTAWSRSAAAWVLLVTEGSRTRTLVLAPAVLGMVP